jgi:hypothetical protein
MRSASLTAKRYSNETCEGRARRRSRNASAYRATSRWTRRRRRGARRGVDCVCNHPVPPSAGMQTNSPSDLLLTPRSTDECLLYTSNPSSLCDPRVSRPVVAERLQERSEQFAILADIVENRRDFNSLQTGRRRRHTECLLHHPARGSCGFPGSGDSQQASIWTGRWCCRAFRVSKRRRAFFMGEKGACFRSARSFNSAARMCRLSPSFAALVSMRVDQISLRSAPVVVWASIWAARSSRAKSFGGKFT